MTRPRITALYEDSRTREARCYALHKLCLAMVADAINEDPWTVIERCKTTAPCAPKKGVDKVLAALATDMERLTIGGGRVVAVLDSDRVREHLGLDPDVPSESVFEEIKRNYCRQHDLLDIVLIEKNVEAVLRAAIESGVIVDPKTEERAIVRKKHQERDAILHRTIRADRSVRDGVIKRVMGMRQLRDLLLLALSDVGDK